MSSAENYKISYAQNREDIILEAFFPDSDTGFYVDIGAYDPDYDSVTKVFYLRGWNGINVEPQVNKYELFKKKRPKDINVNLGISDKNTTLKFRSYDNQGLSTFSEEMKSGYEHEKGEQTDHFVESSLKVITLKNLFKKYEVTQIQFMKVDVEGLEYEVLVGNDWSKYRPEVICIEADHIQRDWRKLLKEKNYSLVFFDGLNEYYTDNKTTRAQKFDYVQAVVFQEPIVNFKLLEDFKRYDAAVAWLEEGKKDLELKLLDSTKNLHDLQHRLEAITPIRKHIKKSIIYKAAALDRKITSKLQPKQSHKPDAILPTDQQSDNLLKIAQEADRQNFENYDKLQKGSMVLPVYIKARTTAIKTLKKVRNTSRRIKERS